MNSRKHAQLAARIRTDLELIDRSPVWSAVSVQLRKRVEKELSAKFDGLGYKNLSYPRCLQKVGLELDHDLDKRKQVLGIEQSAYEPTINERRLVEMLVEGSDAGMSSEWIWRCGEWCREMADAGWYPFFVTLTVDPKFHDPEDVFGIGSTVLRDYFKRLARLSMRCCDLTRSQIHKASDRDFLQKFCVVEHGKSGEHHHAHALIWFREIPDFWKLDPNKGVTGDKAVRRRCHALETYWPYCIPSQRPANYYRHLGDVWSRLGHKNPIVHGKGLDLMPASAAGVYCSKYMSKEDKKWKHRVKATRRLGLNRIVVAISQCPKNLLQQMEVLPPTYPLLTTLSTRITVPLRLMRRLAKLELYCREYQSMALIDLLRSRPKPYKAMCKSLEATLPWLLSSEERYDWLLSVLPPDQREFCERQFFEAIEYFEQCGFRPVKEEVTFGLGGLEHEHV